MGERNKFHFVYLQTKEILKWFFIYKILFNLIIESLTLNSLMKYFYNQELLYLLLNI